MDTGSRVLVISVIRSKLKRKKVIMFAKPCTFLIYIYIYIYISNCKTSSFPGNEKEFKLPINKTNHSKLHRIKYFSHLSMK